MRRGRIRPGNRRGHLGCVPVIAAREDARPPGEPSWPYRCRLVEGERPREPRGQRGLGGGRKPTGFTLIELLVAAALSALAAVVLAGALAAGLRVWGRATRLGGDYASAVTGLELLRKDLRNSEPHRLQRFEGAATWVEFPAVVTRVDPGGTNAYPGAVRYEFMASGGEIVRVERTYVLPAAESERKEVLMTGVAEVELGYGDRGEAGVAGLQWVTSWSGRTNAPSAVRVRVALRQGEGFDQTVVLPRN